MPLAIDRTGFDTVDGYAIVDIPGAPTTAGPIRCAKKVLDRTTIDLVRHATYALAIHQQQASGAAAALNHDRASDDADAFDRFAAELDTWMAATRFHPVSGVGLGLDEVGLIGPQPDPDAANLESAIASAGRLTGARVVVSSPRDEPELARVLDDAGVNSVRFEPDPAAALVIPADATIVRVGTGALHHEVLENTASLRIVALTPLATTARGLAVASKAGAVVVPDFISAGGQYLSAVGIDDIASATRTVMDALVDAGVDTFLSACRQAEAHLRTWADDLPFGRPLAP